MGPKVNEQVINEGVNKAQRSEKVASKASLVSRE